jgi:hypothetical protein
MEYRVCNCLTVEGRCSILLEYLVLQQPGGTRGQILCQ